MTFDHWFEENVIRVHNGIGSLALQAMKQSYKYVWDAAIQSEKEKGEVVVTKNPRGEIVLVSRQDEDGQILSVIAEPGFTDVQLQTLEQAKSILNVRGNKENLQPVVEKSVAKVKEVRNRTGRGLMEAKKALEDNGWNVVAAVNSLQPWYGSWGK